MSLATNTLAAIDKAVLDNAENEHRRHLGASMIGDKCARALWYKFRWAKRENFDARLLRLFNRGHREEAHFSRLLREAGMEVWAIGQDKGDCDVRISGSDGHFGGTPDGVVRGCPDIPEGEPALLEYKTASASTFAKFKAEGVMKQSWKYFVQVQIYMGELSLAWCLWLVVNKDTDEIYGEIIRYDEKIHREYMGRADMIVKAEEPPPRVAETPGYFVCAYCQFKNLCFFSDIPDINCRTCAHATIGPNATWLCAKGRVEIAEQTGCPEHLYDPRFFDDLEVVGGNFDQNWLEVRTSVETMRWGPRQPHPSARLLREGFVPF